MPKRSTEFQRLVALVKTHVAVGATVTESQLLRDLVSGEEREVDVVIETSVGGHPVVVSIECTETARVADIGWVERMKAKHDRLPTNVLVLASKSGLSRAAQRLAESYGIQIVSFATLDAHAADSMFGSTSSLWSKTVTLSPTKVVIIVAKGEDKEHVAVFPDNLLYSVDGSELGQVKDILEPLLRSRNVVDRLLRDGGVQHKWFDVHWNLTANKGLRWHLKSLDPDELREILHITIRGTCCFEISSFNLRKGIIDGVKVAWGTSSIGNAKALWFAAQDVEGGEEVRLSVCAQSPLAIPPDVVTGSRQKSDKRKDRMDAKKRRSLNLKIQELH